MQVDSTLLQLPSLINDTNGVKDMVLQRLLLDGIITEEQSKTYSEKWQIIIFKRSWYKRWLSAFVKESPDAYQYKFVKFED